MKTTVKILVLLSLMLTGSLALAGQKTLLLQDIQPLMAFASDTRYNVELSAEYNSNSYRFYIEDKIQLQDWMTERSQWESIEKSRLIAAIQPEKEQAIAMEDWMTRPLHTEPVWLSKLVKADPEEPLVLQAWMICCTDW
jgi:hypothetical protein